MTVMLIQIILLILFCQRTGIIKYYRNVLHKVYGTFFWQTEIYLYTFNFVQ